MHAYDGLPDLAREDYARLMALLRDGTIRPAIGAAFPLGMAAAAHALLDSGAATGKILLQPGLGAARSSVNSADG